MSKAKKQLPKIVNFDDIVIMDEVGRLVSIPTLIQEAEDRVREEMLELVEAAKPVLQSHGYCADPACEQCCRYRVLQAAITKAERK